MFYHDKCQFQNVIHEEGNDSIILEAYALANIAHLRVLYGVVNDYEESFKNLITFADPVSYGLTEVFTKDLKFVIKFLSESEFNEYTSMLFAMFSHFCEHPKSFLPKISGLYKLNYNSKFHYITVIFNIYPLKLDKNRIKLYNLTGSDSSISNKEDEQPSDPMKQEFENDWPGGITIPFSNIYEFILQDLKCDFDLLKSWNKMNYSLFVVVIRYNNLHTNPSDPQEIRLMQYVKSSISSTHKGQSHYKNAIVATMNDDRLIIFMGIIDNPLKSTDDASLKDDEKSKSSPQELEDYKNQLMQFITEYVIFYKWLKFSFLSLKSIFFYFFLEKYLKQKKQRPMIDNNICVSANIVIMK